MNQYLLCLNNYYPFQWSGFLWELGILHRFWLVPGLVLELACNFPAKSEI